LTPQKDKLPQWISDNFTDLNLKLKAQGEELDSMKAGMVTKQVLVEQFGLNNKAVNELFAKYDKDVRAFIQDQIVQGVTEGLKQYDVAAKANFLTRGDLAAAGAPNPTTGTPLGAPGQQQGRGFLDTIGDLIMKAITTGTGPGGTQTPSMFEQDWAKYRALAERRLQLNWQKFLQSEFGPLPEAVQGTGHVELSG
jgi:hypothetical protein